MASIYFLSPARHVGANLKVAFVIPDVEVFEVANGNAEDCGWYYWARFPDEVEFHGQPNGPYGSHEEALNGAILEYVGEEAA